MSRFDLRARPIYHHKRESIEAHLSIVMAALAVGRLVEQATGWSINRFVKALRPCRTITIQAGEMATFPDHCGIGPRRTAARHPWSCVGQDVSAQPVVDAPSRDPSRQHPGRTSSVRSCVRRPPSVPLPSRQHHRAGTPRPASGHRLAG